MRKPLLRKWKLLAILLPAAALLALAVPAMAQEPTPVITDDQVNAIALQEPTPVITDDEVNRIASQMFCPVCENTPLDVCPTQACHQWRETIRLLLAEGKTEQEIKDHFVLQYGDRVLAQPPRSGFNWLVYVIPPLVILVGAVLLVSIMKNWQTATARSAPPPTIEDDEYVRRLEEELQRRS